MTDTPPTPRKWLQFRLKTLLITVLVLSLPLAGFNFCMHAARRQRQAAEVLEQVGTVYYDREVDFDPDTPPDWMVDLFGVDFYFKVVVVELDGEDVTDEMLEHVKWLPHLETLHVQTAHEISEKGLLHLGVLEELDTLTLSDCQVTDTGLRHLKKLRSLKYLTIDDNPVTDAGLEHLKKMPHLVHLSIRRTSVTSEGVEKLNMALPSCAVGYAPHD